MILTCPDCGGSDDRLNDRCSMCSDPGCWSDTCLHERLEKYNAGCECDGPFCDACGADLDGDGSCWRCDIEDEEDRLNARSGLL